MATAAEELEPVRSEVEVVANTMIRGTEIATNVVLLRPATAAAMLGLINERTTIELYAADRDQENEAMDEEAVTDRNVTMIVIRIRPANIETSTRNAIVTIATPESGAAIDRQTDIATESTDKPNQTRSNGHRISRKTPPHLSMLR